MATTAAAVPRAGSCTPRFAASLSARRMRNLPYIEHPMSRQGDVTELSVTGGPTPGMRRERTALGVGGSQELRLAESAGSRILQWPPEYIAKTGKPKNRKDPILTGRYAEDELIYQIRERMANGMMGVKHMFKANDPNGQGNVSKEALLRILYQLCGYIPRDKFEGLVHKIGFNGNNTISFENFVNYFKESENLEVTTQVQQREWVNPVSSLAVSSSTTIFPEEHLRSYEGTYWETNSPATLAFSGFKDKLQRGEADIMKLLPPACLREGGMTVGPQFREALAQASIHLSDSEFQKLWERFDRDGVRAVRTSTIFQILGLDPRGRPKNRSARGAIAMHKAFSQRRSRTEVNVTKSVDVTMTRHQQRSDVTVEAEIETETKVPDEKKEKEVRVVAPGSAPRAVARNAGKEREVKEKVVKQKLKVMPRFESVSDSLHWKVESQYHVEIEQFEQTYHQLLAACQLFDFLNDGYISRVDLRHVLREFGLPVAPVQMEHFLSRLGLRSIKGQVNYRDFLLKFQNRSEGSITDKVMTSGLQHHVQTESSTTTTESLSAVELESRLVEMFHGDFIQMTGRLKAADRDNSGEVEAAELRQAIGQQLGTSVTDKQWRALTQELGLRPQSPVDFQQFLQSFDTPPGTWNQKQEGGFTVSKVKAPYSPAPPVERLKERAKSCFEPRQPPKPHVNADGSRTVAEVTRLIEDLFRQRFHTFDKRYKDMDLKMTGRLSKWQFGALLRLCGLTLGEKELERVWATLHLARDGMVSYSSLVQHFNALRAQGGATPTPRDHAPLDNTAELVEKARKVMRERREQKKRSQAEVQVARAATTLQPTAAAEKKKATTLTPKQRRRQELVSKVKADVQANFDPLRHAFRSQDWNGHAHIPITEAKEVLDGVTGALTEEEKAELINLFDTQGNGRFHYLQFMRMIPRTLANGSEAPYQFNRMTHTLEKKRKSDKGEVTIGDAISTIQDKLMTEWKNLRRAFKKMDPNNDGFLEVVDFKRILKTCSISATDEDLYHIMSEFDANMDGRISYDEFLNTLLNM